MSVKFDGDWIIPIVALQQTLAGAMGGMVRWMLTGGPVRSLMAAMLVGAVCGRYLAPVLASVTGITTTSELADAFIMGAVGSTVVLMMLNMVDRAIPTDPKDKDKNE